MAWIKVENNRIVEHGDKRDETAQPNGKYYHKENYDAIRRTKEFYDGELVHIGFMLDSMIDAYKDDDFTAVGQGLEHLKQITDNFRVNSHGISSSRRD